ncbi:MAG: IS1595 family transposase [Heliomarina sp.]|uniref:IS1595 family transposase n=1 Tax=Heliomarina sp. TaxID=2917556 RepID=UPI00405998C7
MRHATPTQLLDILLKSISELPPAQILRAEAALATARRRAEAVVEIDEVGQARACPHCGSDDRVSWGSTRAGARRWRCQVCSRTWTGRTNTPLAHIHRLGLFIEALRNMLNPGDNPLSCRKLGARLGVSRDTVWRWRMIVFNQLLKVEPNALSGIIETDETFQRESRKGSREWVRHAQDPTLFPQPPRKRWHEYGRKGPPQSIVRQWLRPLLGVVDRTGLASFQHIRDNKQPTIEAALMPQVAPDAMVLFDGAPQYEAIARTRGFSYTVLVSGRRWKSTPKAYHLNTVNSLHAEWKGEFRKKWRGPASKYLDGYARWMVARRHGDPLTIFRALLADV